MSLLIHSLSEFSEIILGTLDLAGATRIAEIGAETGGFSLQLADFAAARGGTLVSIDPAPRDGYDGRIAHHPAIDHRRAKSLDVIADLSAIDAWIIDGDHNYFTVRHELEAIAAACRRDDKPLLAVLHDVGWPCARRDCYYDPSAIPEDWRHPHDADGGVLLDRPDLVPGEGFRGCGDFAWATHEGGPRNGVLTAVEDVTAALERSGMKLAYAQVPAVFGLGILFAADAPWSAPLAEQLLPLHQSPLLQRLERNRLENYLKVIELQDRNAA